MYRPLGFNAGFSQLFFFGKDLQHLLFVSSRVTRVQIAISGTPNCLNYCLVFMVFKYNTLADCALVTPALHG
jgi:hypothetical protein